MSKIVRRLRGIFRHLNDERAFTLVELLIVLAIIGVLATIAVPSITKAVDGARLKACQANISAIEAAAELFYTDYGRYPTTEELKTDKMVAYFKDNKFPECPLNGGYSINEKTGKVTCDHKLPGSE
ncbi:MAG TPA: prepilin-type N-terminal cleavage/methylation domain-containing protein [Firmicutes bacterium]|nr:prepilin-type N-terminal cleavage/methylation domain-containing protein [Bacillota bacterium]